jgi:serine/threonine protein kinase
MGPSVESLCNQIARSRLLDATAIRDLRGTWRNQAGRAADDVSGFRQWLVESARLSEFQLDMMERGYGDFLSFGEYILQERIGTGRMAGVYKAVHALGQTVAIKVLPPAHAKEPNILGRFLREARMALKVSHDNVVRAFQSGVHKDLYYIVMEYVDGESLEETLRRRQRLALHEAMPILIQALEGLNHLHELGLVHRDLKPGNLMLIPVAAAGPGTLDCTVKILDIGLGRALFDEGTPKSGGEAGTLTSDGAILGTLNYMAPEQARSAHAADIRADIYSLGCVLYEMLTGLPPFVDANFARQMRRHAEEKPASLAERVPGLPPAVDHIAQKMLAKDPAMRYAVPRQVLKDLNTLALAVTTSPFVRPMRSYLTWLESQPKDALPEAVATGRMATHVPTAQMASPFNLALPVATPIVSAVAYPAAPLPNGAALHTPPAPPIAADAARTSLTNPVGIFVSDVWGRIRAFGWSKRDWTAAAVGAATILLIQGILWLAGKVLGW